MNTQLEKALFNLYQDEINIDNFNSYTTLLKTLILYKKFANIESYFYENKFDIISANEGTELPSNIKNSIVIGGKPYMEDENIDQLISGFINRNIEEESDRYKIYLNHEDRVVHITKMDCSYGYSVFNSSIEKVFCAMITKIVPWYFSTLPAEVMQEFAPLFVDNDNFYLFNDKFEMFIEESGLKNEIQMKQMANLAVSITKRKKRNIEDNIRRRYERIDSFMRDIAEENRRLNEERATLSAIEIQGESYESPVNELLDFIKDTTEKINIEEVYDESVKFKISTVLEHYDEETYKSHILENPGTSYLFGGNLPGVNHDSFKDYMIDDIKEFYEKVMIEKTLKVHVGLYVTLNIVSGQLDSHSTGAPNTMPHPHLGANFNCWGNASGSIMSYTTTNRYLEAMHQILYCAKQFTISDSAAGKYMLSGMINNQCIECPDGEFRNFDEAMAYLGFSKM